MKISANILTATAMLILMHLSSGECKRIAPAEAKPVIHNSIRYTAPHWGIAEGHEQNGGLVQAWDVKTRKMLWEIQVYKTEHNDKLERDVQDVFITSLTIKDGKLLYSMNETKNMK